MTYREWLRQRATVNAFAAQLNASDHIAVVTFATEAQLAVPLQQFSAATAALISALPYQARLTNIARALRLALSTADRSADGRVATPTAVVIVSDGLNTNDTATMAAVRAIVDAGALFVPVPKASWG